MFVKKGDKKMEKGKKKAQESDLKKEWAEAVVQLYTTPYDKGRERTERLIRKFLKALQGIK